MSHKSMRIKIEEYLRRKAEDRQEQDKIENSREYKPRVPDDR